MDNCWFHCAEQFIQLKKAEYFNDRQIALKILASHSAIECKQLARNIKNYDITRWNEVAEDKCYKGILEKFSQNLTLIKVLKNTGNKAIAESCYDRKWELEYHSTPLRPQIQTYGLVKISWVESLPM